MEPSENNKIKYYSLQILSLIATLILSILTIKIVLHMTNFDKYYPIVYFMVFGAVFVFIKQYFANYSYKNKYLYLAVIIISIVLLYQSLIRLHLL